MSPDAIAVGAAIGQRASVFAKAETQRLGSIFRDGHRSVISATKVAYEPTRLGSHRTVLLEPGALSNLCTQAEKPEPERVLPTTHTLEDARVH